MSTNPHVPELAHTTGPLCGRVLCASIAHVVSPFSGHLREHTPIGVLHPTCAIFVSTWRHDRYLVRVVPPYFSPFTACLSLVTFHLYNRSRNMASQVHRDESAPVPSVEKQHETELSLESALHYKAWKPDRKEKMALAVQTLCVVRPAR